MDGHLFGNVPYLGIAQLLAGYINSNDPQTLQISTCL